jgi:transcriptional regulator NrdR family protein
MIELIERAIKQRKQEVEDIKNELMEQLKEHTTADPVIVSLYTKLEMVNEFVSELSHLKKIEDLVNDPSQK